MRDSPLLPLPGSHGGGQRGAIPLHLTTLASVPMKTNPALSALRHHVSGAIARGEAQAITEVPATPRPAHTPGPWDVEPKGSRHFVDGADGLTVAYIDRAGVRERIEIEANARLIAAAPTLLEALEAVLPDLEHYVATHGPGPDKRLAIARAAIAKARG